ncbi:MAG: hypothetical protein ACQEQV_05055 [Fibrobacterota bacterium]
MKETVHDPAAMDSVADSGARPIDTGRAFTAGFSWQFGPFAPYNAFAQYRQDTAELVLDSLRTADTAGNYFLRILQTPRGQHICFPLSLGMIRPVQKGRMLQLAVSAAFRRSPSAFEIQNRNDTAYSLTDESVLYRVTAGLQATFSIPFSEEWFSMEGFSQSGLAWQGGVRPVDLLIIEDRRARAFGVYGGVTLFGVRHLSDRVRQRIHAGLQVRGRSPYDSYEGLWNDAQARDEWDTSVNMTLGITFQVFGEGGENEKE